MLKFFKNIVLPGSFGALACHISGGLNLHYAELVIMFLAYGAVCEWGELC